MDKMREEFVKFFTDKTGVACEFDIESGSFKTKSVDVVANSLCDVAWQSWKASRAALCVELPKHEAAWWSEDVLDALNNAGVSHK